MWRRRLVSSAALSTAETGFKAFPPIRIKMQSQQIGPSGTATLVGVFTVTVLSCCYFSYRRKEVM